MEGFGLSTYGDGFADVYDAWYGNITDSQATASFLAARCVRELPVLELGVGSGRLIGDLINRGLRPIGVDSSAAMLSKCLESHPSVPVIRADLALLPIGGPIGGALLAFNTLFNLASIELQSQLLTSLAATLHPKAPLVIEAVTGAGLDDSPKSSVGLSKMTADTVVLSAVLVDAETQVIQGQHIDLSEGSVKLRPWLLRWTTPKQLDETATAAGLELTERWGGWNNEPFTESSEVHVSVYQRSMTAHLPV